MMEFPLCARDFACGLPLSRFAGSLTPAKRLTIPVEIKLVSLDAR